jgi:hypothetical protein
MCLKEFYAYMLIFPYKLCETIGRIYRMQLIECNPGPRSIKYPCGSCNKACRWNQKSVACDKCDQWFHTAWIKCSYTSIPVLLLCFNVTKYNWNAAQNILFIMWFAPGICLHMGGTGSSEVVNQIREESMFINMIHKTCITITSCKHAWRSRSKSKSERYFCSFLAIKDSFWRSLMLSNVRYCKGRPGICLHMGGTGSSEVVNQIRVESMFININFWTLGFLNYQCLM